MKVARVMSRQNVIDRKFRDNHVCISISTPKKEYDHHVDASKFVDMLRVEVNDSATTLDETQAIQILDFISKHDGKEFIIHCDAGLSRSAGIGVYLRDFERYRVIFENGDTLANKDIKVKLLRQKQKQFYGDLIEY